jgi:monoamine oxidase
MLDRLLDRRDFLQTAAVGAVAGPLLGAGTASAQQRGVSTTQAPVLIIGAGPAGITAAYYLKQANIDSIVLEGNNRVGGRILTSNAWHDTPVDLGASWLSNAESSPLAQLVKQWGITSATRMEFGCRRPRSLT